jgi:hypothetical protein
LAAKVALGTCLMAFLQPPLPGDCDAGELGSSTQTHTGAHTGSRGRAGDRFEGYAYFGRGPASQGMLVGMAAADGWAAGENFLAAGPLAGRVVGAGLEYCHTSAWVWALYLFLSISTDLGQVSFLCL